jgi:hypothetical protein
MQPLVGAQRVIGSDPVTLNQNYSQLKTGKSTHLSPVFLTCDPSAKCCKFHIQKKSAGTWVPKLDPTVMKQTIKCYVCWHYQQMEEQMQKQRLT